MSKANSLPSLGRHLLLNFETGRAPPIMSFARQSEAFVLDEFGQVKTYAAGIPRVLTRRPSFRGGLLVERAGNNLLNYNIDLNSASWSIVGATKSDSPVPNFIRLTSNGQNFPRIVRAYDFPAGEYSLSFTFSKAGGSHIHCTVERLPAHTMRFYMDLTTGEVRFNNSIKDSVLFTDVRYESVRISPDIIKLCISYVQAVPTSGSNTAFFVGPTDSFTSTPVIVSDVDIGPIQVEGGLSPTSIMPSLSTIVSRAAESNTIPLGSSLDDCTVAIWYSGGMGNNRSLFSLSDSVTGSAIIHEITNTNNVRTYLQDSAGFNEVLNIANQITSAKSQVSILGIGKSQQFAYSKGVGYKSAQNTLNLKPFNTLTLGHRINGTYPLNGLIHKVMIFPRLLTQQEVTALADM